MKPSNLRLFITYIMIVIIVLASIGTIIISIIPDNVKIIVGLVLTGEAIVFSVLIYYVFDKYIVPLRLTTAIAEEMAEGNYEQRTSVTYYGDIAKLNNSLNMLAKELQEKTKHEGNQDKQLRTVIDNMESGLMMVDDKGYVQLINRAFSNLFWGQSKNYIGSLYWEKLDEEKIHQIVQETFFNEVKVKKSLELLPSKENTEKKYIEIVGAPLLNDKQYVKGVVLVFHDITELKRLEQIRKDFVANVSHELKTPITSIRGFAETLIDEKSENEELRIQFLSIILTESQRLQTLVHDLLELSKLDKEEIQLKYTKVNINKLIQEILPHLKQQSDHKEIKFLTTIENNTEIDGDYGLLQQVFQNLLSNAINYTSNGGEVVLEVTKQKDTIRILVTDTGIGIPQEMQSRIFERFFRVDKTRSRNTGGTGLGLAIVKHIIEAHMGTIQVKSGEGIGTSFIVVIPKSPVKKST